MSGIVYCLGTNPDNPDNPLLTGLIYLGLPSGDVSSLTAIDGFTLPNFNSVKVNRDFAGVIDKNGDLWMWGINDDGQLGQGDQVNRYTPVLALQSVESFAITYNGSVLAIKTDGSLWAWGYNGGGCLGLGDTTIRTSPVQVGSATWSSVSNDSTVSAGIQTDGSLWSWGANYYGELGQGDSSSRHSPTQVGIATSWVQVVINEGVMGALDDTGTMWMCGDGSGGRLGQSNTTSFDTLQDIGLLSFKYIGDLGYNCSALGTDDRWYCWGPDEGGDFFGYGGQYFPNEVEGSAQSGKTWDKVFYFTFGGWLLLDLDGHLWQQSSVSTITQLSEQVWTDISTFSELMLGIDYIISPFWTLFKGQTETL